MKKVYRDVLVDLSLLLAVIIGITATWRDQTLCLLISIGIVLVAFIFFTARMTSYFMSAVLYSGRRQKSSQYILGPGSTAILRSSVFPHGCR